MTNIEKGRLSLKIKFKGEKQLIPRVYSLANSDLKAHDVIRLAKDNLDYYVTGLVNQGDPKGEEVHLSVISFSYRTNTQTLLLEGDRYCKLESLNRNSYER
jgi:hypothetical protein